MTTYRQEDRDFRLVLSERYCGRPLRIPDLQVSVTALEYRVALRMFLEEMGIQNERNRSDVER